MVSSGQFFLFCAEFTFCQIPFPQAYAPPDSAYAADFSTLSRGNSSDIDVAAAAGRSEGVSEPHCGIPFGFTTISE
jgi:hypothetical protein